MSTTKVFVEVDENAMEQLDTFIQNCYRHKLWWKYLDGFDNDCCGDTIHPYQYALNDVVEAKKLAKAFGLYPYNQPNYSMEME